MSQKVELREAWEREFPITLRLLNAFPAERGDFKPHEKSKSAIEVAWMFVTGQRAIHRLLDGTFTPIPNFPPPPKTWNEVIAAFESDSTKHIEMLNKAADSDLKRSVQIVDPYAGRFTGMKDMPSTYFMWFLLCDHIHHRGQLSVYLRLAGGKVPSIYGPSADDPWK
jgi:uncharacterized damage-inducible protein DinB